MEKTIAKEFLEEMKGDWRSANIPVEEKKKSLTIFEAAG